MFNRIKKNWDNYQHEKSVKKNWADYHDQVAKAEEMLRERFSNTPLKDGVLNTCAIIYVDTDNDNDRGALDLFSIDLAYDYPVAEFVMMRAAKRFGWKREINMLSHLHDPDDDAVYI